MNLSLTVTYQLFNYPTRSVRMSYAFFVSFLHPRTFQLQNKNLIADCVTKGSFPKLLSSKDAEGEVTEASAKSGCRVAFLHSLTLITDKLGSKPEF